MNTWPTAALCCRRELFWNFRLFWELRSSPWCGSKQLSIEEINITIERILKIDSSINISAYFIEKYAILFGAPCILFGAQAQFHHKNSTQDFLTFQSLDTVQQYGIFCLVRGYEFVLDFLFYFRFFKKDAFQKKHLKVQYSNITHRAPHRPHLKNFNLGYFLKCGLGGQ